MKRLMDAVLALAFILLTAVVQLLIAILVPLDSHGPPLYVTSRVGRLGRPFGLLKFRTMLVNADRIGPGITLSEDPRITRIGSFLRRSHLDEMPQLYNVLVGHMSLVGPRPEAPKYVSAYPSEFERVLQVRPGITGLAQLEMAAEEAALAGPLGEKCYVEDILPRKLEIDLSYIARRSGRLDFVILVRTIRVIVGALLGAARRSQ